MDCVELNTLIAYRRREVADEAALTIASHLRDCPSCSELFELMGTVGSRLEADPGPALPAGFRERVLGGLDRESREAGPGRTLSPHRWASMAAAVAVTIAVQAFIWNPLAGSSRVHTVFAFASTGQSDAVLRLTAHPDGTYSSNLFAGRHTAEQIRLQLAERERRFSHALVSSEGAETVVIDLAELQPLTEALGISSVTLKGNVVGTMNEPSSTVRGRASAESPVEGFRLYPLIISQSDLLLVCHGSGLFGSAHFEGLRTVEEMLATAEIVDRRFDSLTLVATPGAEKTVVVDLNQLRPLAERLNISSLNLQDGVQGLLRQGEIVTPGAQPETAGIIGWLRDTLGQQSADPASDPKRVRIADAGDGRLLIEPALIEVEDLLEVVGRLRERNPSIWITLQTPPEPAPDGLRRRLAAILQDAGVERVDFQTPPGP